ncbi:dihydropteroate synthase [Allostella sp. ATCC 35155]|nr:dihydropteroate synthase [Stella sp. ATCC 35155]
MDDLDQLLPSGIGRQEFYLRPLAIETGSAGQALTAAGMARPLAGGPAVFAAVEVSVRQAAGIAAVTLPVAVVRDWIARRPGPGAVLSARLDAIAAPRPPVLGIAGPAVMGIVNVTPDSFSDGGDHLDPARAVDSGLAMMAAGAAFVDVGGESTRPGAAPVSEGEELRRVLPVVERLAAAGARVSIDTRRARVMREAVAAGAVLVNDVTALAGDIEAPATVAAAGVPAVLMHMQGEPQTMQQSPRYDSVLHDIHDYLAGRLERLTAAGLPLDRLIVDPGIGFGKTLQHNLAILGGLGVFLGFGVPLLVGLSRKGFIGRLGGGALPRERLGGSLAGALWALARGASILRVHDVGETVQALALWQAMAEEEGA